MSTRELTFPPAEREHVQARYDAARVILEYGSGGSTFYAASQPGKFVMSVETSRRWMVSLQREIDAADLPSMAILEYRDIGETGRWGRPLDETSWAKFYRYPTAVWTEPYFRDPDLILVDGRFRAATFIACFLRIQATTRVLFDDYFNRPSYHVVERLARPVAQVGRMAEFLIEPGERPIWMHDLFLEAMGGVTFADGRPISYEL